MSPIDGIAVRDFADFLKTCELAIRSIEDLETLNKQHDHKQLVKVLPSTIGNRRINYVPHHGVYHPAKPSRIRVVFDCSAVYKGTSLNKNLLQGLDLMNSLMGVLCRFRLETVALTCDAKRMFH